MLTTKHNNIIYQGHQRERGRRGTCAPPPQGLIKNDGGPRQTTKIRPPPQASAECDPRGPTSKHCFYGTCSHFRLACIAAGGPFWYWAPRHNLMPTQSALGPMQVTKSCPSPCSPSLVRKLIKSRAILLFLFDIIMKIYIKNIMYGIFQIQLIIISTKKYIFSLLIPWSHYKQFT